MKVVTSGEPFQLTTDLVPKFAPLTVISTLALPGAALRGERDCASKGRGLLVEADPVPVMLTTCGLSPSLSQTNNCAASAPCITGENETLIVQEAPGARVLRQLFICWKSWVKVSV